MNAVDIKEGHTYPYSYKTNQGEVRTGKGLVKEKIDKNGRTYISIHDKVNNRALELQPSQIKAKSWVPPAN